MAWTSVRRPLLRRLAAVLGKLDPDASESVQAGDVEELVSCVERAADRVTGQVTAGQRARARLVSALGFVAQGVVVCDEAGVVVFRNPQAEVFVGARHGEALTERSVAGLLSGALAGHASEETIELFSPFRRTLTIRAAPLRDETAVSGMAVSGMAVLGAVAVIEDVSERRRLEAVRRDFVANISHELKTPVGALSLVAETLQDEDDPEVVARLSRRMQAEAERLNRIIEDLLDLSRIESEESPAREPVAVGVVVAQALARLVPVAEHRGIGLDVAPVPPELEVRGDRRQLVAAVHNLVDNAIKYSERGSSVSVSVSRGSGWVEIAVVDHGIGIPARDLERIFERFYRVDRARSRDTGGTGLGLAIVRHVAGNHGGEVRVESREGQGSTFVLVLPAGPDGAGRPGGEAVSEGGEVLGG
jgi:two-component system sensor histidine kinase SenX3